jgi:predicted dinucleotide-binding enzyme
MTTAIIGTGGIGSVIARQLASGGETLRFAALKGVIDEIADPLTDKLVVVPSDPLGIDAQGNVSRLLPEGQSSGRS